MQSIKLVVGLLPRLLGRAVARVPRSLGIAGSCAILLVGLALQSIAAPLSALKPAFLCCEYRVTSDPTTGVSPEREVDSLKGVNGGSLSASSRESDDEKRVTTDLGATPPVDGAGLGRIDAFNLHDIPPASIGQGGNLQEKVAQTQWAGIRGANFIPSYAANTYEIWRNYDHDLFDQQLRLASVVGYNSVRLWLNYAAYEELGSKMIDHVEDALRLCAKYKLRAVVVLFDSCGIRPRKDTRWMTASDAYDQFQSSSRFTPEQKMFTEMLFKNYVRGFGANTMVPVASDSPMMALLYQKWVPTPGNDRLGLDWYPRLEKYVDAVIGRLKDNPTVLLWDLMNEPEWASEGPLSPTVLITPEMKKTRDAFLQHFHDYIKRCYPNEIISVGWARLESAEEYSSLADVVTFHVYGGPEIIQSDIDKAQAFSERAKKQILITETLANWDFGEPNFGSSATDEKQLAHYQEVLPTLVKSPIGWIAWGLVISQDFDPYTDILYPDGHPRPAALFLEKALKGDVVASGPSSLRPAYLRCEYRIDPIGMDQPRPRLSWILESSGGQRGQQQRAYQIQVARSLEKLESGHPDVWDTGKKESAESAQVIFDGSPLQSAAEYFWRVKVWDEQGAPSAWSAAAKWTTGLRRAEWGAQWISDPDIRVSPEVEAEALKGVNSGYISTTSRDPDTVKWVGVDLGATVSVDGVRLYPAEAFNFQEGAPPYYFPVRYRVEAANLADFSDAAIVIDHTDHDQPAPELNLEPLLERFPARPARYVRVVVTRLQQGNELFSAFALAELQVYSRGSNVAQGKTVLALDSEETPGWSKAYLVDGRIEPVRMGRIQQRVALLRKSFSVQSRPRRAILYVTARGLYEIRVNGNRVGDHLLAPEWTVYDKRSQYQAYDVTSLIGNGENILSAYLAAGWYSGKVGFLPTRRVYGEVPQLLAHLTLQNQSGEQQVVVSDGSWRRFSDGPIRSADIYDGETYDARKEVVGWDRPGFDDRRWQTVQAVPDDNAVELSWQRNDAVRAAQEIRPISIKQRGPGVYIFDMGQNMVGWVRLKVNGPAGATINLRHAEVLTTKGDLYTANLREAWQTDRYTLSGRGQQVFEPHFTYHGFRYVEVSGLPEPPTEDTVTGIVFYSSSSNAGEFSTSSEFVNRLMKNILWTQHGNMMGILTDCPQRPERLGWTGDLQIFAQASIYNMDMETFYEKFLRDLRDDQLPNGRFPDITPNPMRVATKFSSFFQQDALYGSPAWADAGIIVPWRLYVNYGDKELLKEHYEAAAAWINYVWNKNPDFLWKNQRGLDVGDWLNGDTIVAGDNWPRHEATVPLELFSTQFFAHSADLMARIAEALDKKDDALKYRELFESIRGAFVRAYVSGDGTIQGDTQAGYALALHFDLLPESLRPRAVDHLLRAIQRYNGGHLSTGMPATNRLMLELTRSGNTKEAYRLLLTHGVPSWGSMMDNGATTVWERWDGYLTPRGFQFPGMNSFNHVAFGAVAEWVWQTIIGLEPDERHPGYTRFIVRPLPGGDLSSAHGRYNSIHGPIEIQWELNGKDFVLNLTVPPNTSAEVFLPVTGLAQVTESGVSLARARGVSAVQETGSSVSLQVGSGQYRFRAAMKAP